MKGLKCLFKIRSVAMFFFLFGFILLSSFVTSSNTSAYNYSGTHTRLWNTNSRLGFQNGGNQYMTVDNKGYASAVYPVESNPGTRVLQYLQLCTADNFRANSLYYFTIQFHNNDGYLPIEWSSGNQWYYSVISSSYGEYGTTSIVVYMQYEVTNCITLYPNSVWWDYQGSLTVSHADGVTLVDSATKDQITALSNQIATMLSNDTTMINNQQAILRAIGGLNMNGIVGAVEDTTDAVNDVKDEIAEQNDKDDQDRSDIESQSSSTNSSASSSQSDVQSASGSVISHITSIVGALSTPSSDCLINIYTGNLQLDQINLCSAPNEIRTLINNIMTLIVTVSVLLCSYSLVRQFLSIYESFIAGGRS